MISHKARALAAALGVAALALAAASAGPGAPAGRPDPGRGAAPPPSSAEGDRLLSRLLARSRDVRDFRARFTQTLVTRGLADPTEERGTVLYLRPGRMRWEYEEPERKLAISDGKTGWLYLPEEGRAVRMDLSQSVAAGPLADLLAGNEAALPAFHATALPERDGTVGVRLVPVEPREEFAEIELRAASPTLRIASVELIDPGGNRMLFRFSEMRENTGLSGEPFVFHPPEGTKVEEP